MRHYLLLYLLISIPIFAQSSGTLKWEQLAVCLPDIQNVSDLERGEVTGGQDDLTYVNVLYYDTPNLMERGKEISVDIEDSGKDPEYLEEALEEAPDISTPILINGKYKGVKIIAIYDSVVDYCTYHIIVAGRFLITLHSTLDGDFTKEIETLIDNFDYATLEKLK